MIRNRIRSSKMRSKPGNYFKETGKKGRRTGLGFTALADAMAALGLKFDSSEAIQCR